MTQLLKKDVSPKHAAPNPADSHRPDSVYRPNPFPIDPIMGYPSAPVATYHYPPPHADSNYDDNVPPPQYSSYDVNTSSYSHPYTYSQPSDGYDTSTVTYPPHAHHYDPARYSDNYDDEHTNNNSHNTGNHNNHNNYNHSNDDNDNNNNNEDNGDDDDDDDDNDDTDPEAKKNNASDVVMESKLRKPSRRRLAFRLIQLLASIGALAFIAAASSASHVSTPPDLRPGVVGLYIVSVISCLVGLFYVCKYFSRRFGRNRKLRRWIMLLIDFVLAFAWGILGYFLIVKFKCPPGGHNGWCNFYNTSIFFNTLAFVTFAFSIFWDMYGGCRRGH